MKHNNKKTTLARAAQPFSKYWCRKYHRVEFIIIFVLLSFCIPAGACPPSDYYYLMIFLIVQLSARCTTSKKPFSDSVFQCLVCS